DKPIGASSGANLWAAIRHAQRATRPENIATVIADAHPHYLDTCHSDAWCEKKKLNPHEFTDHFHTNTRLPAGTSNGVLLLPYRPRGICSPQTHAKSRCRNSHLGKDLRF